MRTSERYKKGLDILKQIDEENYEAIVDNFKHSIAPDLGVLAVEFNYGQIFSRPGLDLKSRLLATVAGLTALGNTQQLKFYINGALNARRTHRSHDADDYLLRFPECTEYHSSCGRGSICRTKQII